MKLNVMYNGDCLIESDKIESGSVDLILTDLPYGNMDTDGGRKMGIDGWDKAIPPKKVYEIANRILRKNGKMILFSQEPYTTELINAAIPNVPFGYRAIWEKDNFANALGANKNMVSFTEDILVFSKNHPKHDFEGAHPLREYFKRLRIYINATTKEINTTLGNVMSSHYFTNGAQFSIPVERDYIKLVEVYGIDNMEGFMSHAEIKAIDAQFKQSKEGERLEYLRKHNEKYPSTFNLWEGNKYKSNILKYKKDYTGLHPTQKPILLLEDLIKTFSNEGDLVVDLTIGSGSTAVACINTNRFFIGIEKDKQYYDIATERIQKHSQQMASL